MKYFGGYLICDFISCHPVTFGFAFCLISFSVEPDGGIGVIFKCTSINGEYLAPAGGQQEYDVLIQTKQVGG